MMENPVPERKDANKNNFISNPSFNGWIGLIGVVLSIVGLYYAFVYNKQVNPVYTVVSDLTLLSNPDKTRVRVYYDSVQVKNVKAVTITIWNAGNEFLSKDAFSKNKPISVRSSKPISILDFRIVKTTRKELGFKKSFRTDTTKPLFIKNIAIPYNYVSLDINSDEGFEANDGVMLFILYTSTEKCVWSVDARIKGVPEGFTLIDYKKLKGNIDFPYYAFFMTIILATLFRSEFRESKRGRRISIFSVFMLTLFILIVVISSEQVYDYFTAISLPESLNP